MLEKRRQHYANQVLDQSMTILFSGRAPLRTADEFYSFTVNRNFFYMTGIEQENVCLVIMKGAGTVKSYLFLDKIDPIKALWDGAGLTFEEASQKSKIELENVKDIETLNAFISEMLSTTRRALFGAIETVYLDLERLNDKIPQTYPISFGHQLRTLYPYITLKTNQMILAEMRTVKDESEIAEMKKAIQITKVGLDRIMDHVFSGRYEFQIEAEYNYVLNLHRTSPSFGTIAASGKNATVLHYRDNDNTL